MLRVGRHGVRRDGPAVPAEPVGDFELVVVGVVMKREGDDGHTDILRQDLEPANALYGFGECLGVLRAVSHDALVALEAEAYELVVLSNNLASSLGEIQCECRLVGAEVIHVEHELLGQIDLVPPDHPADTGVH